MAYTLVTSAGVDTLGNETVVWVPTIANPVAATVAEVTASTALVLSMVMRGFEPGGDQGTSTDIRLGTKVAGQNPGRFNPDLAEIVFVDDPQAISSAASVKHREAMTQGAKGYILDFRGIDPEAWTAAAAQNYDVYYVTLGKQVPVAVDPSAEGAKFEYRQKPFVAAGFPKRGTLVA